MWRKKYIGDLTWSHYVFFHIGTPFALHSHQHITHNTSVHHHGLRFWSPGHMGNNGNVKADQVAALNSSVWLVAALSVLVLSF
jgi:hypothetical protein